MQGSEPSAEPSTVHDPLNGEERDAREDDAFVSSGGGGAAVSRPGPGTRPTTALTDARRLQCTLKPAVRIWINRMEGERCGGHWSEGRCARRGRDRCVRHSHQPGERRVESLRVEGAARRTGKQSPWGRAVAAPTSLHGHQRAGAAGGVQAGDERAKVRLISLRGQQAHGQPTRQRSRHPSGPRRSGAVAREEGSVAACDAIDGVSGTGCCPQTGFARGRMAEPSRRCRASLQTIQHADTGSGMISRSVQHRRCRARVYTADSAAHAKRAAHLGRVLGR